MFSYDGLPQPIVFPQMMPEYMAAETDEERELVIKQAHEQTLTFVTEGLKRWTEALTHYSGQSEKTTEKVEKVLSTLRENDELVTLVDNAMKDIRSIILDTVRENVDATYLLFADLDDVKKAVGTWRKDANVNVENDGEDDEDRNLVNEYKALESARVTIEGQFQSAAVNGVLSVTDLPEKYRRKKMERVNNKNVPVTPTVWELKFPGKLASPLNETESGGAGRVPISFMFSWEIQDSLGVTMIGKASIPYLARFCSTNEVILSIDDILTSLKAKYGKDWGGQEVLEIRTPRGTLTGTKVKK